MNVSWREALGLILLPQNSHGEPKPFFTIRMATASYSRRLDLDCWMRRRGRPMRLERRRIQEPTRALLGRPRTGATIDVRVMLAPTEGCAAGAFQSFWPVRSLSRCAVCCCRTDFERSLVLPVRHRA